jgi:hypothetical protein
MNDIPAFPSIVEYFANGDEKDANSGMTLRDYFAAQALVAMASQTDSTWSLPRTQDYLAEAAYGVADAMLKARGK